MRLRPLVQLGSAAALAAVILIGCTDTQAPPIDTQVSDGGVVGGGENPDFFFLPPLVPLPRVSGTFDATLLPYLRVEISGPFANDDFEGCPAPTWTFDAETGLRSVGHHYVARWKTRDYDLTNRRVYRICVTVAPPNVEPVILGFRDVRPLRKGRDADEGDDDRDDHDGWFSERARHFWFGWLQKWTPVYDFRNGRTLPIRFRVEEGALNTALCTAGDPDPNDPNAYDCTAEILASNESAFCDNFTCAFTAGEIAGGGEELFIIEKFGLGDPLCTDDGETHWLDVDIPQYAGCVRVTVPNADFGGFEQFGTVGACFYEQSGPNPLKVDPESGADQDESIQLHIQYDVPEDRVVWALPWAAAGIEGTCEDAWSEGYALGGGGAPGLGRLASRTLRRAQQLLNPWFAPPRAYAFHTGFGGHTSLRPTESGVDAPDAPGAEPRAAGISAHLTEDGGAQLFLLAWALPSQMAPYALSSGESGGEPGDLLVVYEGDPVAATVLVTDNGATGTGLGRVLGTPRTVLGARVHFAVDHGPSTPVLSDANGLATFNWTAAGGGIRTLTARGFGIGTEATGGPFDALGASPALLGTGEVVFQVCVLPKDWAPPEGGRIARSFGPCD